MTILPVSNIINVSISNTPSGLVTKSVNKVALFTNETPNNNDIFRTYVSASQVATDYGSSSVTAKMATNIFAQTPNILSGGGGLVIIPLQGAVSATAGKSVTPVLTSNLSNLIAVTNGDIGITVNGVNRNLLGMNFTGAVTLADIAAIIQNKITDAVISATATQITVTSLKTGTTSTIAFATPVGGTGTSLAGSTYLNTSASTATGGANSSGETILNAIARTSSFTSYFGVMTNMDLEDAAISTIAAGIQSMDYMFFSHAASPTDIAGIATTISNASQTQTRILTYMGSLAAANLFKAAYVGRALSTDFSGSNTAATMNLKQLANVIPDPNITQTIYNAALTAGTDTYVSFDGIPSVSSSGANEYFDNIYANFALKFSLISAGFNFLRQTATKVPQTEGGMNGLKNAYSQVLQAFVTNGSIAPGLWTGADTFGDPAKFKQNITDRGYYVYSLPVAQQQAADRNARKAPLVQIAMKRSGAVHKSDVLVFVNN